MSAVVVAFLFAAGVAAWTYSKVSYQTGSASTSNTLVVTGFVGLLAFLIFWSILNSISN